MNTSGRFEFPTELAVTGAEYSATHDAPVHRRESLMSSIAESEGSASSSEDSDASLEGETDDEKEEESKSPDFDFVQGRRMLAAMMANQQRSANMDTTADVSPPKPSLPRDVKIAMLREFGDVLYTSAKGITLQKPQQRHYIELGWHHHPERYCEKFEEVAERPQFKALMEDVFEEMVAYTPGREPSPGAVRRHIEQKIFLLSNRGRNFAQKQWAHYLRAHHTPLCVRELVEQYGDSATYSAMYKSLKNCDSDRDACLIAMIMDFLHHPFSQSLDNFQKGFKVNVTSKIETSKFCQMTDMSAVWCETNDVGSVRRTPGFVMTSKPDLGGDVEDNEVLSFLSVEQEWLQNDVDAEHGWPGRARDSVIFDDQRQSGTLRAVWDITKRTFWHRRI